MACTATACTTNSAKPWPSEISQKAGVRSASRAVKSRVVGCPLKRRCLFHRGISCAIPSTTSPMLVRAVADHQGERQADARWRARREPSAVVRQPKVVSDRATSGTMMPPKARPIDIADSARARLRSNQWISATLSGKKPHRLVPSAMTMNAP